MRVTKEVAAQNKMKIVEAATNLFKTRGIDNVSVADLMTAAGFTHGGFYNHFASKADLAIETIRYAFEQALSELSGPDVATARGDITMTDRLDDYLSPSHRDDPKGGCPTGSLPVDVGRQSIGAQQAFAHGIECYVRLIEDAFPPRVQRKREVAIATLSTLVGAIILSRAVRDARPRFSTEILQAARVDLDVWMAETPSP
jgi:TetR/AcrR family transcriptional repressor of nem operon